MFVRVVRFTDVTAERLESLVARIDETGPPPGVPIKKLQLVFDEGHGTNVRAACRRGTAPRLVIPATAPGKNAFSATTAGLELALDLELARVHRDTAARCL